jgi:hypothetical protein
LPTPRSASIWTIPCAIVFLSIIGLFGLSACGGGGGDNSDPTQPTGKDSVSATVGPSGGQVTTPSGEAGVQIPAGVLAQNATITVTRLPGPQSPGQGPLPTTLNQYGPYYEIQISPANAQLGDSVRVGVCQVTDPSNQYYPPESSHPRLRLAHTVGNTTEILEPVGVADFLRCTNVTADADVDPHASRFSRAVAMFSRGASRIFSPRAAYAAHGGLGGKVKSFSPFGAVDPLSFLNIAPEFGIATTSAEEDVGGVAYDGTNYMVITEARDAQGGKTHTAQFVSPNGTLVGGKIAIPAANGGDGTKVAFDGTNYLVVWTVANNPTPAINGQFISKAGALVGSAFTVANPGNVPTASTLAFGGGTYFMAYTRSVSGAPDFHYSQFGRLISPAGVVGAQLALSSTLVGDGFNNVAFDGARFFTVYSDGGSVKGKFVSTSGVVSAGETIIATGSFESIATVGYNGVNYLVTMASRTTSDDAVARLVNTSGITLGGPISIAAAPGGNEFPVNVVRAGNDFIVSFVDSLDVQGKSTAKARFVSATGATRGPAFTFGAPANGKDVIGFIVGFSGEKYLGLLLRGFSDPLNPGNTSNWTQADVTGVVVTVPIPPGN